MLYKKLSFIIPVYNAKIGDLQRCIGSIENQNCDSFEIIIVNDGSTNKEIEPFCKDICKSNSEIIYVFQENQGSAVARNTGLDNATGTHIVFVDADDCLDDHFFEKLTLMNKSADILCLDYIKIGFRDKDVLSLDKELDLSQQKNELFKNTLFAPDIFKNLMFGAIWAKVFSKNFIDNNDLRFIPELRKAQDRVFMLQAYIKAKTIYYAPFIAYHYYYGNESITHKMNFRMIEYYESLNHHVKLICQNNGMIPECYKYFGYSIFIETLKLTYFNKEYSANIKDIKLGIEDLYKRFDMEEVLSRLCLADFNGIKSKIKLILFKKKAFRILRLYFSHNE